MPANIIPVARSLYLCDRCYGLPNAKVWIDGLFNSIQPPSYPYHHREFSVFAQLTGGLGAISVFVDITYAPLNQLVHTTHTRQLSFPRRDVVVRVSHVIQDCQFDQSGLYLLGLFCDNVCVADVPLLMR
jgi:hypothetical protein